MALQDELNQKLIHEASNSRTDDRIERVMSLLRRGASIDAQGEDGSTVLLLACYNKNFEVAKLLVKQGANVDIKNVGDNTAFQFAASKRCDAELLSLMIQSKLKAGVDLQSDVDYLWAKRFKPDVLPIFETAMAQFELDKIAGNQASENLNTI